VSDASDATVPPLGGSPRGAGRGGAQDGGVSGWAHPDEARIAALSAAAVDARTRAWAPYSRFQVGAALLCEDGTVVTGCNVENASYGLTVCAERTALLKAVSEGHRRFVAIAIATDMPEPATPCGMCRQAMAEFADDLPIYLVNPAGARRTFSLAALLPGAFKPEALLQWQAERAT
jgi:cytidine deaminase